MGSPPRPHSHQCLLLPAPAARMRLNNLWAPAKPFQAPRGGGRGCRTRSEPPSGSRHKALPWGLWQEAVPFKWPFLSQLPHPGPRPPSSWPPENRPGDSSSSTPPLAWPRGPQPIKPAPQQPQELGSSSPEWGGEGAGASACLGTTRKGRGWSSGWEGLVPVSRVSILCWI